MSQRVRLLHRTAYRYDRPVRLGPQWIRLRPLADPRGPAPEFELTVQPEPGSRHWMLDAWNNPVLRVTLPEPLRELLITVRLGLDMAPRNPFDFVLDAGCAGWPFTYDGAEAGALAPFLRAGAPGPLMRAMRAETGDAARGTVELLLALGRLVADRLHYGERMEPGVWLPERTLSEGRGSCRDSAWLLVELLRLHGIAARFVSGYLVQFGTADAEERAELHAWAEAFLPGAGWVGIDATSGLLAAEGHVALAAAPEPAGTAPLSGTVEPSQVRLDTAVTLERPAP